MTFFVRWQYFGSTAGIARIFPGREWSTNFAGFYNDYDPRVRPWYIAATSGPKDVVIILDCRLVWVQIVKYFQSKGYYLNIYIYIYYSFHIVIIL